MIRKDVGVVLRRARSGETSLLATFLGRATGKINVIGKGAMSGRSPFRGTLEIGNLLEIVYYYKEGRTLFFLKEVHVKATLGAARDSLPHLASALGVLELVEEVCYWGSPEESVVDLLEEHITGPPAQDPMLLYLVFAFKLLAVLGVVPDVSSCSSCGGDLAGGYYHPADGTSMCGRHDVDSPNRVRLSAEVVAFTRSIVDSKLEGAADYEMDRKTRKRFGEIIHWTYTFHIQGYRLPKALKLVPRGD